MIKTIIFDNGGVIVTDDWLEFINDLAARNKADASVVGDYEQRADRGKVELAELKKVVAKYATKNGINYDPDVAGTVDHKVIEYIKKLKEKYEVALLTNEFSEFDHYEETWHFEQVFGKNIFTSAKIGFAKPEPEAYQHVLKALGRKPSEVIFVDDREANVRGAQKVGITAILYQGLDSLDAELKNLLK